MRPPCHVEPETLDEAAVPASAAGAAALIASPLVLILAATVSGVVLPEGDRAGDLLQFLGHPFTALILTTLAAFYVLGVRCGFSRRELEKMAGRSLGPVGQILLVTGAGGVLGKVLVATGVGEAVTDGLSALVGTTGFVVVLGISLFL